MILGPNVTTWPPKWRERYEERAAIHEFEAGLSRAEAERRARLAVQEQAKEERE